MFHSLTAKDEGDQVHTSDFPYNEIGRFWGTHMKVRSYSFKSAKEVRRDEEVPAVTHTSFSFPAF